MPVKTPRSNLVYKGSGEVRDLDCEREAPGVITSVWALDKGERRMLTRGANIAVTVLTETPPPIAVEVTAQQPLDDECPSLLAVLRGWWHSRSRARRET